MHPVRREPISIIAPPPEDAIWDEWVRQEHGLAPR
jgi:hypothetical protein